MKIIDISMAIHENMATYKSRPEKRPKRVIESSMPSDTANESSIIMNLHTGTHIDAPLHMLENGAPTTSIPQEKLITPAKVLDVTSAKDGISRADLEKHTIKTGDFVLLKARNSLDNEYRNDFVYLGADAAEYLARIGVRGVGIDTLGIERDQPGHGTHKTLLAKDIVILEGIRLSHVVPGDYLLIALPLKISRADGAPARAILLDHLGDE